MLKIFSDKPRKYQNLYIGISSIIFGIPILIVGILIAIDFNHWSVCILIITGVIFLVSGAFIIYKNFGVFELDRLAKVGDTTPKLYEATEKKLVKYLETNKGTAFTAKALIKRIEETIKNQSFKKFALKNGEKILNKMVIDGKIQSARKNDIPHYFVKEEI